MCPAYGGHPRARRKRGSGSCKEQFRITLPGPVPVEGGTTIKSGPSNGILVVCMYVCMYILCDSITSCMVRQHSRACLHAWFTSVECSALIFACRLFDCRGSRATPQGLTDELVKVWSYECAWATECKSLVCCLARIANCELQVSQLRPQTRSTHLGNPIRGNNQLFSELFSSHHGPLVQRRQRLPPQTSEPSRKCRHTCQMHTCPPRVTAPRCTALHCTVPRRPGK